PYHAPGAPPGEASHCVDWIWSRGFCRDSDRVCTQPPKWRAQCPASRRRVRRAEISHPPSAPLTVVRMTPNLLADDVRQPHDFRSVVFRDDGLLRVDLDLGGRRHFTVPRLRRIDVEEDQPEVVASLRLRVGQIA